MAEIQGIAPLRIKHFIGFQNAVGYNGPSEIQVGSTAVPHQPVCNLKVLHVVAEPVKGALSHPVQQPGGIALQPSRKPQIDPRTFRKQTFPVAAQQWLETQRKYLRERTFTGYRLHIQQLNKFFGALVLKDIHIGHVMEYQRVRETNEGSLWTKECGPSIINHEIVTLQSVMGLAGVWKQIAPHYRTLPLPSSRPPKVMSDVEELRLFDIGSKNPEWSIAYWVASITLNTGASGTELRNLRFEDVHLDHEKPWFRIDDATAKNVHRGRPVILNQTAIQQVTRCVDRAKELGSCRPEHYVFPFRVSPGVWDATRPTTDAWLRRTFGEMAEAAGIPWLTPHCLRHQHITLSMEAGEPLEQIALRVGHISPNMTRWYISQRPESQLQAVNAIDPSVRFAATQAKNTTPRKLERTAAPKALALQPRRGAVLARRRRGLLLARPGLIHTGRADQPTA